MTDYFGGEGYEELSEDELREIALEVAQNLLSDVNYSYVTQQEGVEDVSPADQDRIYRFVKNATAIIQEDD